MEEIRICAFFDALGTSGIMLENDKARREDLIRLVRNLSTRDSNYNANVQNLGLGITMSPSAQATSFSDNVAISFPIQRLEISGQIGDRPHTFYVEASQFLNDLLAQITIAVWDGLKIGVLFRGAITIGRLVHDDQIIAGEALVKAVDLEKKTKWPRIEIAEEIIELKDDNGTPIICDEVKELCLECEDGKWFFGAYDYHWGYWRDHNYFRQQNGLPPEEITIVLSQIRERLDLEYNTIVRESPVSVQEKWDWFFNKLENTFQTGTWSELEGAYGAMFKK